MPLPVLPMPSNAMSCSTSRWPASCLSRSSLLLEREVSHAQRYGRPFAVVLLDLDHFKRVNDKFGHAIGDQLLVTVANVLRETIRDTDIVARYGGEEFLAIKGARTLRPPQLAVLRALWGWRDARARDLDRAPFRVLGNDVLLVLAKESPTTLDALARIRGVPSRIAERHGEQFVEVIRAARALPEDQWPRLERRPRERPDPQVEERMVRLKALRAERAPAVGLDPGLVCANAVLAAIARAAPRDASGLDAIPDLRRWQREIVGDERLLRAVG